ncbi:MAG: hypothetical protein IPJ03_17550 [Ignavibacteriales bacterium]|nr:hypothetical protein [Ignavibacteriales bacterium]
MEAKTMMKAEDIVKLPPKLFKFLAKWTADKIKEDALKGIFQNDVQNSQLSEKYKRQKGNFMKRFTKGGKLKDFDPSQDFRGKRLYGKKTKTNKGRNISSLKGISIKSNETRFSNMYLTGQTLNSSINTLTESGVNTGFILSFNPRDTGKILGNRDKYGRDLVNIREKNLEFIQKEIEKELDHSIDKFTKESLTINI